MLRPFSRSSRETGWLVDTPGAGKGCEGLLVFEPFREGGILPPALFPYQVREVRQEFSKFFRDLGNYIYFHQSV